MLSKEPGTFFVQEHTATTPVSITPPSNINQSTTLNSNNRDFSETRYFTVRSSFEKSRPHNDSVARANAAVSTQTISRGMCPPCRVASCLQLTTSMLAMKINEK